MLSAFLLLCTCTYITTVTAQGGCTSLPSSLQLVTGPAAAGKDGVIPIIRAKPGELWSLVGGRFVSPWTLFSATQIQQHGLWCQVNNASNAGMGSNIGDMFYSTGNGPDGFTVAPTGSSNSVPYQQLKCTNQIGVVVDGDMTSNYEGFLKCNTTIHNLNRIANYWVVYSDAMFNSYSGPTMDSTMTLSILSSRDADPNIEYSLSFTVSFGPPSKITCTRDGSVFLAKRGPYHRVTREVIKSRYISSTQPDMTRVTVRLDPQPRVGATYNCTVTVEGRINIASGDYDFDIRGSGSSNVTVTVAGTPTAVTVTRTAATNVSVSWTAPASGPTLGGYEVFYKTATGSNGSSTTTNTELTLTGLVLGQTYSIFVVAFGSERAPVLPSAHSNTENITLTIPQPTGVTLTSSTSSIIVSWTAPQFTPDSYNVSVSCLQLCNNASSMSITHLVSDGGATSHNITPMTLNPGNNCTVRVAAVFGSIHSESDSVFTTTITKAPTGAPGALTSTSVESRSFTVVWGTVPCPDQRGSITGYRLRYSNGTSIVNTTGEESRQHVLTGLTPFTSYSEQVAAVNAGGTGPYSPALTVETLQDIPGPVSGLSATSGVVQLTISWSPPSEPNGRITMYQISYSTGVEFNTSATQHTLKDLPPNTVIVFSVRAYTIIGPGENMTDQASTTSVRAEAAAAAVAVVVLLLFVVMVVVIVLVLLRRSRKLSVKNYSTVQYMNGSSMDGESIVKVDNKQFSGQFPESQTAVEKETVLFPVEHPSCPAVLSNKHPSPRPAAASSLTIGERGVHVLQFGEYVAQNHANTNKGFITLYKSLKNEETDHAVTVAVAHKPLNRFNNIIVYDDNRIILQSTGGRSDCRNDYINACYIDGFKFPNKYIATQGPLSKTLIDFWRLMWQEHVPTIVMVTNLKELDKVKCHQYWPDVGSSQHYGPFVVTSTDQQMYTDYIIRQMQVELPGYSSEVLSVTQYHFTSWPDHGVPEYATPILTFRCRVKQEHKPSQGHMLVHCSAGVGRTGTFIAIDIVLEQAEKEKLVDISGAVTSMRQKRMKMVQTTEQFAFIHDAVLESVTCGDTQISTSDLRSAIHLMQKRNNDTNKTPFEVQFEVLSQVTPNPNDVKREVAQRFPKKNRSEDFLPPDKHRVILKGELSDYIHATYVNGYKHKKAFIVAQNPMENTARDFLKMLIDRNCGVIVTICSINETDACYQYWPTQGYQAYKNLSVKLEGQEKHTGYVEREMVISLQSSTTEHKVTQFHIQNWNPQGRCTNMQTIIAVVEEVIKVQRRTGNNPIVVHCSDTVSRSGMFCAIATTIDRCKTESVVDVFQVVKAQRIQKPGLVLTVDQYRFVFEAMLSFFDSFDTYANFR